MKTPLYDRDPLIRTTITVSPEVYTWLNSDKRNQEKLRAILDKKLGTETVRRVPASRQEK